MIDLSGLNRGHHGRDRVWDSGFSFTAQIRSTKTARLSNISFRASISDASTPASETGSYTMNFEKRRRRGIRRGEVARQASFIAYRPRSLVSPLDLAGLRQTMRDNRLEADQWRRPGRGRRCPYSPGRSERSGHSVKRCVSAWNIDPSGGVIGVQF